MGMKKHHQELPIDWQPYTRIYQPFEWLKDILHRDSHPATSILIKQRVPNTNQIWTRGRAKLEKIDSLQIGVNKKKYELGMQDLYSPINPMFSLREEATKENLAYINWVYVDLDNKTGDSRFVHRVLSELQEKGIIGGDNAKLPDPTVLLESGTGLWLMWRVKSRGRYDWNKQEQVNRALAEILKDYGADFASTNANRICRIAGSINSKSQKMVQAWVNNSIAYDLEDLVNRYVPQKQKKAKNTTVNVSAKSKGNLKSDYELAVMKSQDLIKLTHLRNGDMNSYRNKALYILAGAMFIMNRICNDNPDFVFDQLQYLNEQFNEPLGDLEIAGIIKSANKEFTRDDGVTFYGIRWTNDKIIDWLDISEEEQQQMAHIRSSKMLKEIHKERDRERKRTKRTGRSLAQRQAEDLAEQMRKVADMRKAIQDEPNISNRQIAKLLGTSPATVTRTRAKYNF